ncbi:MAG: AmmeMemoRadiSam system protein B [Chlorobi bacterium]|nr:AmmeMemoRadiSam system protein B [Chlorobiota bacterium]
MKSTFLLCCFILTPLFAMAQIPMEKILNRVTIPPEGDLRGLVDTIGFPHTAEQMDFIARYTAEAEKQEMEANRNKFNFNGKTSFIYAISPHDDYMLAARNYVHIYPYIKANTVILIGNAHWSEAFGIRNRLILGDFRYWRGPYGPVKVSPLREELIGSMPPEDIKISRTIIETEHSLEALIPFLQYYNRNVEIIPILIPFTGWDQMNQLGKKLAQTVAAIMKKKGLTLGKDLAILCTTDGQHYGDYGWSYYNFHPFGCDADGYKQSMKLDETLVNNYLTGPLSVSNIHDLYGKLINEQNISEYKVTWCGRFSVTFSADFATRLTLAMEDRTPVMYFLSHGSCLSDPWLPLKDKGMGVTADANLHRFVTYIAIGGK